MFKRFIPSEYQPLLAYISPAAFKVIDWVSALSQLAKMSKNTMNQDLHDEIFSENTPLLPGNVQIHQDLTTQSSESEDGEDILDIYFSQFFSEKGILLDLRPSTFSKKEGLLLWNPQLLIHTFSNDFRKGMLSLYEGFYSDNEKKLYEGLYAVGLVARSETDDEVIRILFSHFGVANKNCVRFEMAHFRNSFHELFTYLKARKIKLSTDFLFLGIYLVTLYLNLSKWDKEYDVKACFERSVQRNIERG